MIDATNGPRRDGLFAREDEGSGALPGARQQTDLPRPAAGAGGSERQRLDTSHESDGRGEHRYPDTHQTAAERQAREDRDDLKRDLAGRRGPRSVTKG